MSPTHTQHVGADIQRAEAGGDQRGADFGLRDALKGFGVLSLIAPSAAGVLRAEEPGAIAFDGVDRDGEAVAHRQPQAERRILRLRRVALRVGLVAPTAAALLTAKNFGDVSLGQAAVVFWIGFEQEDQGQTDAVVIDLFPIGDVGGLTGLQAPL